MNSGNTLATALQKYIAGVRDEYNWLWMDNVEWPDNSDCAFWDYKVNAALKCE